MGLLWVKHIKWVKKWVSKKVLRHSVFLPKPFYSLTSIFYAHTYMVKL